MWNAGGPGDMGSILGLGRSPGEGNDKPLQYSCLKNLMDRVSWWAAIQKVTKSDTTEQLNTQAKHRNIAYWFIADIKPSPLGCPCLRNVLCY